MVIRSTDTRSSNVQPSHPCKCAQTCASTASTMCAQSHPRCSLMPEANYHDPAERTDKQATIVSWRDPACKLVYQTNEILRRFTPLTLLPIRHQLIGKRRCKSNARVMRHCKQPLATAALTGTRILITAGTVLLRSYRKWRKRTDRCHPTAHGAEA